MFKFLGIVWASLSFVALLKHGLDLGDFSGPAQLVLEYFSRSLDCLFGWLVEYIIAALNTAFRWAGWELSLQPHWRYIFSVILLYAGAQVNYALKEKHIRFAIFRGAWGAGAALLSAVSAGVVPVAHISSNWLIPLATVFGLALHQFGNNVWVKIIWDGDYNKYWPGFRFSYFYPLYIIGFQTPLLLTVAVAHRISFFDAITSPGLASLPAVFLVLALFWLSLGVIWTARVHNDESWWRRFKDENPTRLAFLIGQAVFGTLVFLLGNAGLSLVGL